MPATPTKVTIGLVQMRCDPRREVNLEKAVTQIRSAAHAGA